jgi:hypothetical protein
MYFKFNIYILLISFDFRRGNTALHECCLLGLDGVEPLDILLK